MIIGVPKELKNREYRVGLTPSAVQDYVHAGHGVRVEANAGEAIGFSDQDYEMAGATIVYHPSDVWASDMVVKVKEPLEEEYQYFREGLILYAFLHLAAEANLTKALLDSEVTAIAYETIQLNNGALPLLMPMSEVAGRMSIQVGARCLEGTTGGKGILLSGLPGVAPAKVVIIGGGIVGTNAARMAVGLGADVTILDISAERLRQLDDMFQGRVKTLMSSNHNIAEAVMSADLLVGAVLIPGARAPRLVTADMVKSMKAQSVIVDVAIDQGGSIETVDRVTTHDQPTYVKHGVIHYAVANIPGAVAQTSSIALSNATTKYGLQIANKHVNQAARDEPAIAKGINVMAGCITHPAVAEAHGYDYTNLDGFISR